jgi:O-antigen ligase
MPPLRAISGAGRRIAWGGLAASGGLLMGALVVRNLPLAVAATLATIAGLIVLERNVALLSTLTLGALAWGSSSLGPTSAAYVMKFAIMAALAATLFGSLVAPRVHFPTAPRFVTAFAGLGAFALISAMWSVDPRETVARSLSLLLLCAAVTAVPLGLADVDEIPHLLVRFGLVLGLVNVLGLIGTGAGLVTGFQSDGRFRGLLINPNTLGYFAASILPPLVVIAAGMPSGRRRRMIVSIVLSAGVGLALTGSRGGTSAAIAGTVAGLLVTGSGRKVRASRVLTIAIVTLVAAVVVFPLLHLTPRTGAGASEGLFELGTGGAREQAWSGGLRLALEQPFAGHGFGTTPLLLPARETLSQGKILGVAHNSYLEATIDLGLAGGAWLMLLALSGALSAYRVARSRGPDAAVATMLLAGVVGGMVEGVVETGMLNAGGLLAFPFWLLVALTHSLRLHQRRATRAAGAAPKPASLTDVSR